VAAALLPDTPPPAWPGADDTPARLYLAALAQARVRPGAAAISEDGRHWHYGQLAQAVDEAAGLLRERGVRRGDRVMLIGENSLALAAFILAAGQVDACAVLENARRAPLEVDAIREHCQPRLVVHLTQHSPDARSHAQRHGAAETTLPTVGALALTPAADSEPDAVAGTCNDVAVLIYTTGTTGAPKGVMLSHGNLLYLGGMMVRLRELTHHDRVYGVLPITHVMGLVAVFGATLRAGAHLHLVPRFVPAHCAAALAGGGITVLQGAPAMFSKLADHARQHPFRAPTLRFIGAGGAPIDATVKAETMALFGLTLHNGYGLTEGSGLCWTRLDQPRDDCSVGLPARGPNVMQGYYRNPALTAQVMRPGGWFNTQDLARIADDGHVFIEGRSKELIISGGFNVYPLEVEIALNAHPDVVQSAVVARQVGGNEEVIAFVEPAAGATLSLAALQGFLAERLSPYKRPREVYLMPALPSSPNGKVLKGRLKQLAQTGPAGEAQRLA
jgi:acyl-CoA synthetase (AMP-forming)/AMP-acid ligase II